MITEKKKPKFERFAEVLPANKHTKKLLEEREAQRQLEEEQQRIVSQPPSSPTLYNCF